MRSDGFLRNFCIWAAVGAVCITARQLLRDVPVSASILLGVGGGVTFGLFTAVCMALPPLLDRPETDPDILIAALFDPSSRPVVDVRERITLPMGPARALALCRDALRADGHFAGVRVKPAAGTVRARGRFTWRSAGERVEIRVQATEGGSEVELRSRPLLRTTLLDWGVNRENVDRIRAALEGHGPPPALAAPHHPEAAVPARTPGRAEPALHPRRDA